MKTFNGHPSRSAWNVSLWINNDEGMYNLARQCIRCTSTLDKAADLMMHSLPERTPDGYRFTRTNVRRSLCRSM